jgi:hypothetical protein
MVGEIPDQALLIFDSLSQSRALIRATDMCDPVDQLMHRVSEWFVRQPRRAAAAPELAATRRPLREAKRQPLIEDCDVRARDCVPMHGRVRALLEIDGSANGYDRRRG